MAVLKVLFVCLVLVLFLIYLFIYFCFITFQYDCSLYLGNNRSTLEWWLVRRSFVFVFDLDSEVSWPGAELEERESV